MTALHLRFRLQRGEFRLDFDEQFKLGGITALFGPNGCGKTTALRAIAGLSRPKSGRISFGEETWFDHDRSIDLPAHRRPVAMVFQDTRLLAHLSVAGNLEYAAKRANKDGPKIMPDDVISRFDIGDLLARDVAELSGGERQRVAIGRALLSRPRLLLMDEPMSALDIQRRAATLAYVENIPRQFGVPVLYVTHAIDEVARLADQLVLMRDGTVAASGPVEETLARLDLPPLTGRFEAGVILSGRISRQDEDYSLSHVDLGSATITLPRLEFGVGQEVRLRVRARDVALALQPLSGLSIRNILPASVAEVLPEAGTAFAEVRLVVSGQNLRSRITRQSADELGLKPGLQLFALIKSVALDRRLLAPSDDDRERNMT